MGLYVSVVLVIGKFVRGFFSEISHSIMFEELPCVDRILKLCTDIFLVSMQYVQIQNMNEMFSDLKIWNVVLVLLLAQIYIKYNPIKYLRVSRCPRE